MKSQETHKQTLDDLEEDAYLLLVSMNILEGRRDGLEATVNLQSARVEETEGFLLSMEDLLHEDEQRRLPLNCDIEALEEKRYADMSRWKAHGFNTRGP